MTVRYARKKVGLLGGSFNPAHDGHRYISLQALKLLGLDEVWWLVSPLNPFKESAPDMASFERRLESARKAANHPKIKPEDFETRMNTRYTADTLKKLKETYPDTAFVWLMGADNMLEFHRWKNWREIMHTVPVAVFARNHYALKALYSKAGRTFRPFRIDGRFSRRLAKMRPPAWVFLAIREHRASSTEIRRKGLF